MSEAKLNTNVCCPLCEGKLATYQVKQLGVDGGTQEREVGCAGDNAPCLLAGKSWTLAQWDELCSLVARAPLARAIAAHDRLMVNNRLRDLVNRWHGNAGILAEMGDHAASKAFLRCRKDLCEATGDTGL